MVDILWEILLKKRFDSFTYELLMIALSGPRADHFGRSQRNCARPSLQFRHILQHSYFDIIVLNVRKCVLLI